tara:strand:+ start:323 stop:562 length:240 start_codon:yes stop_codon:yes gene_type:complete
MINQTYKLKEDSSDLEFFVAETNELEPHRDIREMAVVMINKEQQIDFSLGSDKLDSLIDYLTRCKEYINTFNENSKPTK